MPEPRYDLADKVVLITGAGGGLGSRLAGVLTQRGARVALLDIDFDAAQREHEHPDDHDSGDLDPTPTIHHRAEADLCRTIVAALRRELAGARRDRFGGHPAAFLVVATGL